MSKCFDLVAQLQQVKKQQIELNLEIDEFIAIPNNSDIKSKIGKLLQIYHNRKDLKKILGDIWRFKIEEAEMIIGKENFYGPEEVNRAFGIEISPAEIPPIGFTTAELEGAKKLGDRLILRVDRAPDGELLTFAKLIKLKQDKKNNGQQLSDYSEKINKEYYLFDDCLKLSWALVSKEPVPESNNKKQLGQYEIVSKYLEEVVYKDQEMPKKYQKSIAEYRKAVPTIAEFMRDNKLEWKQGGDHLEKLAISKLVRRTAVEALYDFVIMGDGKSNGEWMLKTMAEENDSEAYWEWTNSRARDGRFMAMGTQYIYEIKKDGTREIKGDIIKMHAWRPDTGPEGVYLSRRSIDKI